MTAVGRGRSWVMTSDQGTLRRPGELPVQAASITTTAGDTIIEETLVAAVQGLNLLEPANSVTSLHSFEEQLQKTCTSGESLKNFVQRLHDRSLEDRQFGMKAAAACGIASTFEVEGSKLRNLVLSALQKDFDDHPQLQTSNCLKFLNSVALLGEIYHRVRLNDGSPIVILAPAVKFYLDLLLGGEEHEMELFVTMLSVNGRKLLEWSAIETENLLLRVRNVLMSRNLSGQCRCWLLLALDLAANRFAPLPSSLQSFYQMHLGSTALSQLQRIDAGLTVETGIPPYSHSLLKVDHVESQPAQPPHPPISRANSVLTKASPMPTKTSPVVSKGFEEVKSMNEDSSSRNWRENGSGRLKSKSPGEKSRKFSFPTSNSNTKDEPGLWRVGRENSADEKWGGNKSQGWGHDDRFEKDESFYGKQEPRTGNKSSKPPRTSNSGIKAQDKPNPVKLKNDIVADVNNVPLPRDGEESWD